jgi:glycosyltransferase involved in cell wall biosynthesis
MHIRLLRLIPSVDPCSGGPIEGICQITPHLDRLNVSTTVASLDSSDNSFPANFPFQTLFLGPSHGEYCYKRGLPSAIKELVSDYDVVVVEGIWQYHSFATWRALRTSKVPYFVYTHGMLDPWFKRTYPLKHLKKWLYWPWADYRVLRDAEAVLFTTEQERQLSSKSFWLYNANEKVMGYGTSDPPSDIERQRSIFLQSFSNLRGKRFFLFLSRIHPKKGLDILIDAFASVASKDPSLHLVIAGPDQLGMVKSLRSHAVELGIDDRITWAGMLTGDLKWGAFRCAELFCLPSHQENFGVVVAEALACGLPVAISEPVNISIEVANSNAGLVFNDSVVATQHALYQWLHFTKAQKSVMRENARDLFEKRFEMSLVASQFHNLLEQTLVS